MGVVNSKMGITTKFFAHTLRAVSFVLTYSEFSAGALVHHQQINSILSLEILVPMQHH